MPDRIVLLLDFETIIAEINPEINAKLTTVEDAAADVRALRSDVHVVVAEDSPMLRDLLVTTLHDSGYRFVRDFGNGAMAYLPVQKEQGDRGSEKRGSLSEVAIGV